MKNRLALFILCVFLLCFAFVACDAETTTPTGTQEGFYIQVSTLAFGKEQYEEYLVFLDEEGRQNRVIPYDSLSELGEFDLIIFLCYPQHGEYYQYLYRFIDSETGREISLYVTDLSKSEGYKLYNGEFENNEICSDLRTVGGDVSGYQTVGEAKYAYVHGQLLSIHWVCRDIGFVLSIDSDKGNDYALFDSYPSDADTLIARLLDRETATDALNALCERIVRENPAAFGGTEE